MQLSGPTLFSDGFRFSEGISRWKSEQQNTPDAARLFRILGCFREILASKSRTGQGSYSSELAWMHLEDEALVTAVPAVIEKPAS